MHHDLLNEQSQQFRRQFRDARVPFCFGNEVVGTGNRRFQFFNCLLFLRDGDFQQHEQFRAGEGSYPQSRAERKLRQKMNLAKMLVDDYRKGRNPFKN